MPEKLDGRISLATPTRLSGWYNSQSEKNRESIREQLRQFLDHLFRLDQGGDPEISALQLKEQEEAAAIEQLEHDYSAALARREAIKARIEQIKSEAEDLDREQYEEAKQKLREMRQARRSLGI